MVFFGASGKKSTVIDIVGAVMKGVYSNQTLDQLKKEYPKYHDIVVITRDDAVARIEKERTTEPIEITAERYTDLLKCLTPCKFGRYSGAEAFHVSERITGSIVTWCVRIGKRHFSMDCTCNVHPNEVIALVQSKFVHAGKQTQASEIDTQTV